MTTFADRLRAGELLTGTFVIELPAPATVEALALAGLDCCVLDLEHSATGIGELPGLIATARGAGIGAIVRLQAGGLSMATRVLDMRPDAVMVPGVGSAAEAAEVVRHCRYRPLGERGLAPLVRHRGDYAAVDRELAVIVQVEGEGAVEEAGAIAATPGVDAVFVGPYDLSQSLGVLGEVGHPAVLEAGRRVADAVVGHAGLGVFAVDGAAAATWREIGASLVAVSTDGQLFLSAARAVAAAGQPAGAR